MVKRKYISLFAIIALATLLTACPATTDATLDTIAKDLDIVAKTNGTVQTTVIEAQKQSLISVDSTRAILTATNTVNIVGQQMVAYTRTLATLAPADRVTLTNMITPAITGINNVIQSNTAAGIKDIPTRQKIQLLLSSLQATIGGVQLAIAGGN